MCVSEGFLFWMQGLLRHLDANRNSSGGKRISVLHISCFSDCFSEFFFSFAAIRCIISIAIILHQCNHRKKALAQQDRVRGSKSIKMRKTHTAKWFMHLEFAGTRHVEHAHLPTTCKQKTSQWTPYSNGNGLIYVLRALYGRNRVCLSVSSVFLCVLRRFFSEVKLEVFGKRR